MKTLKNYWEIGDAWGKTFRGRFQVVDRRVVGTPFCSTDSPPVITRNYEVLPLKQCLGLMKVSFQYKGQEITGVVDLTDHLRDFEPRRTRKSQLAKVCSG